MKHILILGALLMAFSLGKTQPVLTQAVHLPQNGDAVVYQSWSDISSPGASGPATSWNFSLFPPGFLILDTVSYVPQPSMPWPNFPASARCAYHRTQFGTVFTGEQFRYFQDGAGSWEYLGFYDVLVADYGPAIFDAPMHDLSFPMSYGDVVEDSCHGLYYSLGVFPFAGKAWLEADAWGSLTINGAFFPEVLRLHEWDSIPQTGVREFQERYRFFAPNLRFPLLTLVGEGQNWTPYTSQSVLLHQEPVQVTVLEVYPNPSQGACWVNAKGKEGVVTLMDGTGRTVGRWQLSGNAPLRLPLESQSPGRYWLRWEGPEQEVVVRPVVLLGE